MHFQNSRHMHIVCVSYFYEPRLGSPEALLEAYPTVSDWADALVSAGAQVTVIQRFSQDADLRRRDVRYRFVAEKPGRPGDPFDRALRVNQAVAAAKPTVVHVNGLLFVCQAQSLRRRLPKTPILAQDHANLPPRGALKSLALRIAMRAVDGVSFTAEEQEAPWRDSRLLGPDTPTFLLMESTSRFTLMDRVAARSRTGLTGAPQCLWVGRLDTNKDPLCVLEGFGRAAARLPTARLAMAYGDAPLLEVVQRWLARHPEVSERVDLLGKRPHREMEAIYNSCDLYVSGSHREGSGYAALEALACGVEPVLTDIPSYRRLLSRGDVGSLRTPGDPSSLVEALLSGAERYGPGTPQRVRAYFDAHWGLNALGREALAVYRTLELEARKPKGEDRADSPRWVRS